MRGNVLAALAAAASIAAFSYWRMSEKPGDELVNAAAIPGAWKRTTSESCNPPLPESLTIDGDGRYQFESGAGVWLEDSDGRFALQSDAVEFPFRIFRANFARLELLNQLGCKATYFRTK